MNCDYVHIDKTYTYVVQTLNNFIIFALDTLHFHPVSIYLLFVYTNTTTNILCPLNVIQAIVIECSTMHE